MGSGVQPVFPYQKIRTFEREQRDYVFINYTRCACVCMYVCVVCNVYMYVM